MFKKIILITALGLSTLGFVGCSTKETPKETYNIEDLKKIEENLDNGEAKLEDVEVTTVSVETDNAFPVGLLVGDEISLSEVVESLVTEVNIVEGDSVQIIEGDVIKATTSGTTLIKGKADSLEVFFKVTVM